MARSNYLYLGFITLLTIQLNGPRGGPSIFSRVMSPSVSSLACLLRVPRMRIHVGFRDLGFPKLGVAFWGSTEKRTVVY